MLSPKLSPLINDKYTKLNDIFKLNKDDLYIETYYTDEEFIHLDKNELEKLCLKLYTSDNIDYKIYIINNLYKYYKDICNEHFDKLLVQYLYNPSIELNEQLLIKIIKESILPIDLKYKISKIIYNEYKERVNIKEKEKEKENTKNIGYELFSFILNENENKKGYNEMHNLIKLEIIQILCETYEYKSQIELFILKYLSDENVYCEMDKYKNMLNISETSNTKTDYIKYIFKTICLSGILSSRYVILGAQYLINNSLFSLEEKLEVEQVIIRICKDVNLYYNTRADAADLLITQGLSELGRQTGREIIRQLGEGDNNIKNIYNNKQNIHDSSIDTSIKKIIDVIMSTDLENNNLSYDKLCNEIIKLFCIQNNIELTEENLNISKMYDSKNASKETDFIQLTTEDDYIISKENYEKIPNNMFDLNVIKSSLGRFQLDRSINNNVQNKKLFIKVWNVINCHKDKDELIKRLFQELIEMNGTCSTGHVSRLANIFSGFELNGEIIKLNIDCKSEMFAVTMAKINKLVENLSSNNRKEDEEYQNNILEELMWNSNYEKRVNLNRFLRENLMNIREELYDEYVNKQKLIHNDTFEINFRFILEKLEF